MSAADTLSRGGLALNPLSHILALARNIRLRLTSRQVGVALVYHTVSERDGDPHRELVPAVGKTRLTRQLRYLRRNYRLVHAAEFPTAIAARRRFARFPVCVTFDDDDAEHVTNAMPILAEEGVPATFFLCGAGLAGEAPWWRRLQRAVDRGLPLERIVDELGDESTVDLRAGELTIHRIGAAIEAMVPEQRRGVSGRLRALAGPDPDQDLLDRDGIAELTENGFEIGFHTQGHDRLPDLDDEQLARAMEAGRDELARATGQRMDKIAYPHGKADPRVSRTAGKAGYRIGFGGGPAASIPGSDPLSLGRFEPQLISAARLGRALGSLIRRAGG